MKIDVILIEDDPFWSKILEFYLTEMGFNLIAKIDNVETAKTILGMPKPDCIVVDVMLGEHKSFEIFDNQELIEIPKIFITASESSENLEQSLGIKNSFFLVKPFHMLTLKSAINYVCSGKPSKNSNYGIWVTGKQNIRLFLGVEDIVYVQSKLNYCLIKTIHNQYLIKTSLNKVKKSLSDAFMQIHRGYLVNINFIEKVQLKELIIFTKSGNLPIGAKYKFDVKQYLINHKLV